MDNYRNANNITVTSNLCIKMGHDYVAVQTTEALMFQLKVSSQYYKALHTYLALLLGLPHATKCLHVALLYEK